MKTTFRMLLGILSASSVSVFALTTVPESYSTSVDTPQSGGREVVVVYEGNNVGLSVASSEAIVEQLVSQPLDNDLIQQLTDKITPPITSQKIANALSAFVTENPEKTVSATAMALVIANRENLTQQNKISIIASAVQTIARQGDSALPAISALIGFASQISPSEQRAALITELRQIAIINLPSGSTVERSLLMDSALVQNNILTPAFIPAEMLTILMARANQQNMTVQLVTTFNSFETQVGQIANSAVSAGAGTNPFASGGAIDTPDNPAGVNSQIVPPAPYGN